MPWYNSPFSVANRNTIIYPGSFDPLTNGHLDLIERSSRLFEKVIVAVLLNDQKDSLFSVKERMEMVSETTIHLNNVRVDNFDGLLVDFAKRQDAKLILRGIRAVSDYEYELQMALMNRKLSPELETVFMMPAEAYSYLSSRLVKEVCDHGGDVSDFVPPSIKKRLQVKAKTLKT